MEIWKREKWIWVLWPLIALGIIPLFYFVSKGEPLFFWRDLIHNIVQAEAIINLVFITLYYAIQTRRLVEEERKIFKREEKRRNADYKERKLEEFFYPFFFKINYITPLLKKLTKENIEESTRIIIEPLKETIGLIKRYAYLAPIPTSVFIFKFEEFLSILEKPNEFQIDQFNSIKNEFLEYLNSISEEIGQKMDEYIIEINKVYKTLGPEDLNFARLKSILSQKAKDEINKG